MKPELNKNIDPEKFKSFYWLKEELVCFCKNNNLPYNASKNDLIEIIYNYLKNGTIKKKRKVKIKTQIR